LGVGFTFGVWIFKTGPLAWNGLLGFWVPVSFYFVWVIGTTIMTARAIRNDDESQPNNGAIIERLAALEAELASMRSLTADQAIR
jgi:hypothetical protein